MVQVRVASLNLIGGTLVDAEPTTPDLLGAIPSRSEISGITAAIPGDALASIEVERARRAQDARLASIAAGDEHSLPALPNRRAATGETATASVEEEPVIATTGQIAADDPGVTPQAVIPQAVAPPPSDYSVTAPKRRGRVQTASTDDGNALGGVSASSGVMAAYLPLHRPNDLAAKAAAILKQRESTAAKVAARQKPQDTTPAASLNIPSSARVSRVATIDDGIDLGALSLIGIFGRSNNRYALVRTPQGSIAKVQRGQRIGGWTVAAIGEDGVRIQKRSKAQVLRLPN